MSARPAVDSEQICCTACLASAELNKAANLQIQLQVRANTGGEIQRRCSCLDKIPGWMAKTGKILRRWHQKPVPSMAKFDRIYQHASRLSVVIETAARAMVNPTAGLRSPDMTLPITQKALNASFHGRKNTTARTHPPWHENWHSRGTERLYCLTGKTPAP